MQLTGIHHLTAITANTTVNHNFYTQTLGLRLVKKTVNQDDTSAYHLFYADGLASPGSDLTFFDWPMSPERRGTHSIARTGLRVGSVDALDYFIHRFEHARISYYGVHTHEGRPTFDFRDPEGQRFCLVVDDTPGTPHPWEHSPVPAKHQIRGLGPITLSVPNLAPTDLVLTQVLNMRKVGEYGASATAHLGDSVFHVYETTSGAGPAGELHVAVEPTAPPATQGAGGVHHVAFRTPTFTEYDAWVKRLADLRIPNSGPVDRFYFKSLYFREPNGILFEIASDEPGFTADEPLETLGQKLSLPPFLESQRAAIEANLHPI
jgi:glyoxalase family protein